MVSGENVRINWTDSETMGFNQDTRIFYTIRRPRFFRVFVRRKRVFFGLLKVGAGGTAMQAESQPWRDGEAGNASIPLFSASKIRARRQGQARHADHQAQGSEVRACRVDRVRNADVADADHRRA